MNTSIAVPTQNTFLGINFPSIFKPREKRFPRQMLDKYDTPINESDFVIVCYVEENGNIIFERGVVEEILFENMEYVALVNAGKRVKATKEQLISAE